MWDTHIHCIHTQHTHLLSLPLRKLPSKQLPHRSPLCSSPSSFRLDGADKASNRVSRQGFPLQRNLTSNSSNPPASTCQVPTSQCVTMCDSLHVLFLFRKVNLNVSVCPQGPSLIQQHLGQQQAQTVQADSSHLQKSVAHIPYSTLHENHCHQLSQPVCVHFTVFR